MSDWQKYNTIYGKNFAFNDSMSERNKEKYLISFECFSIHPSNYDLNISKKYKGIITWNSKHYNNLKLNNINTFFFTGFPRFDDHYTLENFIPYENKIEGTCLICRHRNSHGIDISGKRLEVLTELSKHIICHSYGRTSYGGEMYKGAIGTNKGTLPSSLEKFQKLNEYKFNLCFENCYDEKWSWDYITEKIFDCFKAKTIPIYWGCYNIEKIIPPNLYIDYREYIGDINKLVDRLKNISKQEYIDMTENAYEFEQKCEWGKLKYFDELLNSLP